MADVRLWAVVAVLVAVSVAGCGSQNRDEQWVARVNQLCFQRESDNRALAEYPETRELKQLIFADRELPVEQRWRGYARARSKLEPTMAKRLHAMFLGVAAGGRGVQRATSEYEQLYQRDLALYRAERALGLRGCVSAPIRPPIGG